MVGLLLDGGKPKGLKLTTPLRYDDDYSHFQSLMLLLFQTNLVCLEENSGKIGFEKPNDEITRAQTIKFLQGDLEYEQIMQINLVLNTSSAPSRMALP